MEFSETIINEMKGEPVLELDSRMFLNEIEEIAELWRKESLIPVGNSNQLVWSQKMLEEYGSPPISARVINDIPFHSWLFYKGKHYDAESPKGKVSPWQLNVFSNSILMNSTF